MSYSNQFQEFDPFTDKVPSSILLTPFSYLNDIARRGVLLLQEWTKDDLHHIAGAIEDSIFEHFEEARYEAEKKAIEEQHPAVWYDHDDKGGYVAYVPEGALSDFGYRERGAFTDFLVFQDMFCTYDINSFWRLDKAKYHEIFAVLALWKMVDALNFLMSAKEGKSPEAKTVSVAAGMTFEALDAICFAEQLSVEARLEREFEVQIAKFSIQTASDIRKAVKEKLSSQNKKAANTLHEKTSQVRAKFFELYDSARPRQRSDDAAIKAVLDETVDYAKSISAPACRGDFMSTIKLLQKWKAHRKKTPS